MHLKNNAIIATLFVAIGYAFAGQFGLLLAVPPSNAAAVWPASGIAIAAVVILGPAALPGILLGGILTRINFYLDATSLDSVLSSLIVDVSISTGATLQAWIGYLLVRRLLGTDPALLKERSILSFLLLAGPVACLTSATTGNTVLWLKGIISFSDFPLSWSTWWIGDSIGVLLFAPVVLCLFARPAPLWRARVRYVVLPLSVLTIIALVAFVSANRMEMRSVHDKFEDNSEVFTSEFNRSVALQLELVQDLKEFFDSSMEVSASDFLNFVNPKLERHPGIQTLEWIARVRHQDRSQFEQTYDLVIKTPSTNGTMQPAAERDVYYPVNYVLPLIGNERARGFDISSNPAAMEAVQRACNTGLAAATNAIELVQEDGAKSSIVIYAPVYHRDARALAARSCDYLAGVTATIFRIEQEIINIQQRHPEFKLHVALTNNDTVVYSDVSNTDRHQIPTQFRFEKSHTLSIAGTDWALHYSPAPGFIANYSSWTIWMVIVGGLLIAAASGIGLLLLTGRTLRTEELVQIRTRELDREVSDRKHAGNLLALEKMALQMITSARELTDITETIAAGIGNIMPNSHAVIMLLIPGDNRLQLSAAPNLSATSRKALDNTPVGNESGACGMAVEMKEQVFVDDIPSDPVCACHRSLYQDHGLKSCISTPIILGGDRILGTLDLYQTVTHKPDEALCDITTRMADIIAIAIQSKETEQKLSWQACHDNLTGLVNRLEFERRITRLLHSIHQDDDEHALCFLDLDQFKVVNDTCGHSAGDELLRQLSTVINAQVRKRDTLARLGGDEFAVIMEHCTLDHALRVANSILASIQDYLFTWEGHTFRVGASIGLVSIDKTTPDLSELLKQADAACYMAKDLGRNRIHIFHTEDESLVRRHGEMQWVTRIQQALEENRFCLYAQEILPLQAPATRHYELLLRMIETDGKHIPPGAFLPAAERYNLMADLDKWVIEQTFSLLDSHHDFQQSLQMISINISGQSLAKEVFLDFVRNRLAEGNVDAGKLCFEITETSAITNLNQANHFISELRKEGCRFALDDFGSGLSSFGYLKNLNVDYLKIDGMFVRDIGSDPIDHAMVRSINEVGQVLGMKTIAEFVENDEIKGMLREIGVDYAQGYGIHKPAPLLEIIASPHDQDDSVSSND